jgi:hypothetical protein
MQQPVGEGVLSGRTGCLRDQLMQAAGAEDVEIARVEMVRIEKALACVALTGPLIIQPSQAAAIEALQARGCGERAEKALVRDPQNGENECGKERPREKGWIGAGQP